MRFLSYFILVFGFVSVSVYSVQEITHHSLRQISEGQNTTQSLFELAANDNEDKLIIKLGLNTNKSEKKDEIIECRIISKNGCDTDIDLLTNDNTYTNIKKIILNFINTSKRCTKPYLMKKI